MSLDEETTRMNVVLGRVEDAMRARFTSRASVAISGEMKLAFGKHSKEWGLTIERNSEISFTSNPVLSESRETRTLALLHAPELWAALEIVEAEQVESIAKACDRAEKFLSVL